MEENKIIKALSNQVQNSIDKVKQFSIEGNTEKARQELEQLQRKLQDLINTINEIDNAEFANKFKNSFSKAQSEVSDFIGFINSVKNTLSMGDIANSLDVNIETIKNKIKSIEDVLSVLSNSPIFENLSKKLEEIFNLNIDFNSQVQKFNSYLNQLEQSVENFKNNVERKINEIQISGNIIGDNVVENLNRNLNAILESVKQSKEQLNNEFKDLITPDLLSTDSTIEKFEQFVSNIEQIGNKIKETTENIKSNFGNLFDDLSNSIDNNAISALEQLSNIIDSLNQNNVKIENPLSDIIQSLKSISEDDTKKLLDLSAALTNMYQNAADSKRFNENLIDTSYGLEILSGAISGLDQASIKDLTNVLTELSNVKIQDSFSDIAKSINELKQIDNIVQNFQSFQSIFKPEGFKEISEYFRQMMEAAMQTASAFSTISSSNLSFNANNVTTPGNLQVVSTMQGSQGYSGGSVSSTPTRNLNLQYKRNPDQFYASSEMLNNDFLQSSGNIVNEMRKHQREFSKQLWEAYEEEKSIGAGVWHTRRKGRIENTLRTNNEIEGNYNVLSNYIDKSKSDVNKVLSANDPIIAELQFKQLQKSNKNIENTIERILQKFTQIKDSLDSSSNKFIDGLDYTYEQIVANMLNTGKKFIDDYQDALKDLPAEMRRQLQNNVAFEDFNNLVREYNKEQLEKNLSTNLRVRNHKTTAYGVEDGEDGSHFYDKMLNNYSRDFGKLNKDNESLLLDIMSTFNKMTQSYDNATDENWSSRRVQNKMLTVEKQNSKLAEMHDELINSMGSDDYNHIANNALRFLEMGRTTLDSQFGVARSLSRDTSIMKTDDAVKAIDMLKQLDEQATKTGESIKNIMETVIANLEIKKESITDANERNAFEAQLEKIKERVQQINNEMERTKQLRTEAFANAMREDARFHDYEAADQAYLVRLSQSHSASYKKIEQQAGSLRSSIMNAMIYNSGSDGLFSNLRQHRSGGMKQKNLERMADLAHTIEAEMNKINKLRTEFDEAIKDPERREEAEEKAKALNMKQKRVNRLANELGKMTKINNNDLKDAPPEIKQVYDGVRGLIDSTKNSNNEMIQMNKVLGLDEFNKDLIKSNEELEKTQKKLADSSAWEKFKQNTKQAGNFIEENILNPLDKALGLMRGGLSNIGLGQLAGLLTLNPLQFISKITRDLFTSYIEQGRAQADTRQAETAVYGVNSDSLGKQLLMEGIDMQRESHGRISYQDYMRSYNSLVQGVIGQYGQSDDNAQQDMKDFAKTSLYMQKAWGIGEGQAINAISTFYKELGMSVKETEFQLAKIGQTAQSLNIPFDKHLEAVTNLAKQYKSAGFEAEYASNIIGNLMFQHNMTHDDAVKMASNIGNALPNMNEGWLAYGALMSGMYSDPTEAIIDLQYGYNDDGTLKEGVADKLVEIFTNNYRMMDALGGSAGKYGMVKVLNQMGITDKREIAKFLNHADDPEYLKKLFEENTQLTTDPETGKQISKENPDDYFENETEGLRAAINAAAEELSGIDKTLNAYKTGIDKVVAQNERLFDTITNFDEAVWELTNKLDTVIKALDQFVQDLTSMLGTNPIDAALRSLMNNPLLTIGGLATIASAPILARGAIKGAGRGARNFTNWIRNRRNKKKSDSGGSYGSGGHSSGGDASEKNVRKGSRQHSIPNSLTQNGNTKWYQRWFGKGSGQNWKTIAKKGGKWGLLLGGIEAGATLLGGSLAEAVGFGEGSHGEEGAGPIATIIRILKDILAALTGGLVNLAGGVSSAIPRFGSIYGDSATGGFLQNVDPAMAMAGIVTLASTGLLAGYLKKRPAIKAAKQATLEAKEEEARRRRQEIIEEEEHKRKQRYYEEYRKKRAQGLSPERAKYEIQKEEEYRKLFDSTHDDYYKRQREYEKLFGKQKGSNLKNILKTAGRGTANIGKSLLRVGPLTSIAFTGWDIYNKWEEIDTINNLAGVKTPAREKVRAVAESGIEAAVLSGSTLLGSLIPIPGVGTAVGVGFGMGLNWLGNKTGAYDWLLDKVGLDDEKIKKEKFKDSSVYKESQKFKKRFKQETGQTIDDTFAIAAVRGLKDNEYNLRGLSTKEKDIWAYKFAEKFLELKADGKSDKEALEEARKSTDELLKLNITNKDIKDLNKQQFAKMIELYEMSGANKETLEDYSKNYFKTEKEARKVLDATSKTTGLSYEELVKIGQSMNLLPSQLAALIAKSVGSDGKNADEIAKDVSDAFGYSGVDEIRKRLKKQHMGTTQIEAALEGYMQYAPQLKANKLTKSELDVWLKAYGSVATDKKLQKMGIDPLKYATDTVNSYRKTKAAWESGGLLSRFKETLRDGHWKSYYSDAKIPKGMTAHSVISNFADAAGLSTQYLTKFMKESGTSETQFAKYLLSVSGDGKFNSKEVKELLTKNTDYDRVKISKIDKLDENLDKQHENDKRFLRDRFKDTSEHLKDLHEDQKIFENKLAKEEEKFKEKMQKLKIEADKERTKSVVDAVTNLGELLGTKLNEVISKLSSLAAGIGGAGFGGSFIDQVAELIASNEGDWGSINRNDNGTLSIGKLQWHATRARDLLKMIKERDPEAFERYVGGFGFASKLNGNDSYWNHKTLTQEEAMAISNLLNTEAGKQAQMDLIKQDVANYIEKGKSLGITDTAALAYFADLYNQRPASAIEIARKSDKTLESLHRIALRDPIMGDYKSRRNNAYELAKQITSFDMGGPSLADGNVAKWYFDNFKITSKFGDREGRSRGHEGLDLDQVMGYQLRSILGGKVIKVETGHKTGEKNSHGNYVLIRHDDGTEARYSHMKDVYVKQGQKIAAGAVIGTVGNTGSVMSRGGGDGSHLHLELIKNEKTVDPLPWLQRLAGSSIDFGGPSLTDFGGPSLKDYNWGNKTLKRGSKGDAVKELQTALKDAGFDPKGIDGIFGKNTEAALKAFQRAHHLKADGIFGKQTMKSLEKALQENTEATKDNTSSTKSSSSSSDKAPISKAVISNVSAYDPFSGIHPKDGLDNNRYVFDIYKRVGSKGISYNDQGKNTQDIMNKARNTFDINVKTSVDPTQHPNFTQILDKYLRMAVATAISEVSKDMESQFSEIWDSTQKIIDSIKSIN